MPVTVRLRPGRLRFLLWLAVRLLTRLLVLPRADGGTKDLEILVLRQQLRVLRRKTGRGRWERARATSGHVPVVSLLEGGHRDATAPPGHVYVSSSRSPLG